MLEIYYGPSREELKLNGSVNSERQRRFILAIALLLPRTRRCYLRISFQLVERRGAGDFQKAVSMVGARLEESASGHFP